MESNEISLHQVKVFQAVRSSSQWITSKEVANLSGVADRTARSHLLKLVKLGLIDQAEVFPAHRYRVSDFAGKRNLAYLQRIEKAAEVFGLA